MRKNFCEKKPKYYLNQEDEFVIENYNFSKPFANFFPGIAGKYGIPMWLFYVNRGQGVCSFGVQDKDHAIMEFFPANKAWQLVSSHGFRTFIKIKTGKKSLFYEPFHNGFTSAQFKLSNKMRISPSGLIIEEENLTLGIKVKIEYFNIPNDSYAALSRNLTITNLKNKLQTIELLDGLSQIVPFGINNFFLKKMSRTIEAWINVENLEKGAPFFRLTTDPADRPETIHINEGNFYLGFDQDGKTVPVIINPEDIFGSCTDLSCPRKFLSKQNFSPAGQTSIKSRMPSAFSFIKFRLAGKKQKTLHSLTGHMRSAGMLNSAIKRIASSEYITKKAGENRKLIAGLQEDIATKSNSKKFDLYAKQTYLDNLLRGGYPLKLKNSPVLYIYSRKHGDLERDYNKFQLQAAYLSQGNGNYRDVHQNRRNDIWFNPEIKDENFISLLNLIQLDGFNPLVIKSMKFILEELEEQKTQLKQKLAKLTSRDNSQKIINFLKNPFTPGELIFFIEESKIKIGCSFDDFLSLVIPSLVKIQEAEHSEGFWSDHWTYNLDLLESYLSLYPEKLKEILFDKRAFTFYDNTEVVKPRAEKYLLRDGLPRQLHSAAPDTGKKTLIKKRETLPNVVRKEFGRGDIYYTSLINKLLCLLVNKLASLDPFGAGIEMEADKPNWYDALNGLPALFGSSSCETFELKRMVIFIKSALEKSQREKIEITKEFYEFLTGLKELLIKNLEGASDYEYWDKSSSLKEDYREKTKLGVSGEELATETKEIYDILELALKKLDSGLAKAKDKGIYYSYFINQPIEFTHLKTPFIKPASFTQKKIPLFLEGQMHALRLAQSADEAKSLYKATKASPLYDQALKMYKVTAPLDKMPNDIGRCRAFAPGWLENESVWLHMEYKYLLEILKQGLYEEFYEEFKNILIPFQKPEKYGRSILENSSFIVSSAFPDKRLHGNGFVARLSGSTAEFLEMWLIMSAGLKPFFLDEHNKLNLRLKPILKGGLFDKKGGYSFNFLSKVKITYHNPKRQDTFKKGVEIRRITFKDKNGSPVELAADTIPAPYAEQVRLREITSLHLYF